MNKNNLFNTVVLVLGIVLTVGLTQMGCQSDTKSSISHEDHGHSEAERSKPKRPMAVQDQDLAEDADLDEVVKLAVENIEKGKSSNDMNLVMNEGIMKLLAVVKKDENHLQANYQLGLFSIESGQLEKAEKRFEKIVLLQPENQEFQSKLAEVRKQLGK